MIPPGPGAATKIQFKSILTSSTIKIAQNNVCVGRNIRVAEKPRPVLIILCLPNNDIIPTARTNGIDAKTGASVVVRLKIDDIVVVITNQSIALIGPPY